MGIQELPDEDSGVGVAESSDSLPDENSRVVESYSSSGTQML